LARDAGLGFECNKILQIKLNGHYTTEVKLKEFEFVGPKSGGAKPSDGFDDEEIPFKQAIINGGTP
jgi:hypothetical protein